MVDSFHCWIVGSNSLASVSGKLSCFPNNTLLSSTPNQAKCLSTSNLPFAIISKQAALGVYSLQVTMHDSADPDIDLKESCYLQEYRKALCKTNMATWDYPSVWE
uniref:Uncharacterized protein n=1 Tax=Sphaerodactylus townsendi TaxID=933632 RepID=A0ACB8FXY8_9SAUR